MKLGDIARRSGLELGGRGDGVAGGGGIIIRFQLRPRGLGLQLQLGLGLELLIGLGLWVSPTIRVMVNNPGEGDNGIRARGSMLGSRLDA